MSTLKLGPIEYEETFTVDGIVARFKNTMSLYGDTYDYRVVAFVVTNTLSKGKVFEYAFIPLILSKEGLVQPQSEEGREYLGLFEKE